MQKRYEKHQLWYEKHQLYTNFIPTLAHKAPTFDPFFRGACAFGGKIGRIEKIEKERLGGVTTKKTCVFVRKSLLMLPLTVAEMFVITGY